MTLAGTYGEAMNSSMVDWDLAVATGRRLVSPGPSVTAEEARAAVTQLKAFAVESHGHVSAFTGLHAPTEGDPTSAVVVVDRPGWIQANASGFRTVLEPLTTKIAAQRTQAQSPMVDAVGAKLTGVQTGSLLAFLATKVLGQYELFPPYGVALEDRPGRLLLVAPNIVAAEREMEVDPHDFRLWVCLHEETHRVQFGAVPWLRGHLMSEIEAFVAATDVDAAALADRLKAAAAAAYGAVREGFDPDSTSTAGSLVEAVQTPAQREVLDRITALMSLLEGHADFVMDGVGPSVIPSVADIRAKFQTRRKDVTRMEAVIRRLLGVEAKLRQYRDGERFVRGVVDRVGMDGFNRVWTDASTLPIRAEIADPAAWVTRVHG